MIGLFICLGCLSVYEPPYKQLKQLNNLKVAVMGLEPMRQNAEAYETSLMTNFRHTAILGMFICLSCLFV